MPCDHCLDRRAFLGRAARAAGGAAALVTIGACGDGQVSGSTAPKLPPGFQPQPLTITVANFPGLATVGFLVQVDSFVAAKRTGDATFDAFSMACTHEGFLVGITNGQRFDCPVHGSRFDNNGAVLVGPAARPLQKLPTSYDPATDQLTIG